MATDFPIQGILDHLVERIVEILPISAAGVTLISAGMAPRYIAASDSDALRFEKLQTDVGQGPCLWTYHEGEALAVPDLSADHRFPHFGPAAVAAGLAAVFTFPLRHSTGRLGALDLYRKTVGELDDDDMAAAQTLADVATAYLLNAEAREEARANSDRFHHSALHDSLTGLANRVLLQQRLEHAAHRAERSHTYAAILFADLDHFKQINDTYGHQVGDELLAAVAKRLEGLVRGGDTLARMAGDEFVFLCEDLASASDVERLAVRIGSALARPFSVGGREIAITASVGMAFAGPGEQISNQLVIDADLAMYKAKRAGGGRHQIIDLREALSSRHHVSLSNDLRRALEREELRLGFQPVVNAGSGQIEGVEALLRWSHPMRGDVSATSMISVAEQSQLITEIGAWVLRQSCAERERWLAAHPHSPLDISVNVSVRQLMSLNFSRTVSAVLSETGMDPAALILEMTEDLVLEDSQRAMTVLAELKALGVRLALDDFGTGYSSLSYLLRLPVDIVKIDRSFIADIGHAPRGGAIVSAVTNLAHVLGLTVTAEGVETSRQRDEVMATGCEFAQGYYFARPMTASRIEAMLSSAPRTRVFLPANDETLVPAS